MKKRIEEIYEFDAPGFPKWFFERYDFQQIKDRIHLITPKSSLIGRMLWHAAEPEIIRSDANAGLKQHSAATWEIKDGEFVLESEYDNYSDSISTYINETLDLVGDEDLEMFFNTLEYLVTEMGIKDVYDLRGFEIRKAITLINSLSTLNDEQKKKFIKLLTKVSADLAKEYISFKAGRLFQKRKNDE